jgi:hypothetical protein
MADKPAKKSKSNHDGFTEPQRIALMQLFESVYVENRKKILLTNFLRGIFFGLGTFLGGTIVVAFVIWLLSQTVDIFPWAHDFTERLINSLQK